MLTTKTFRKLGGAFFRRSGAPISSMVTAEAVVVTVPAEAFLARVSFRRIGLTNTSLTQS